MGILMGSANWNKKSVIAQKEPKSKAKLLVEKEPRSKIPDSEIHPENIIFPTKRFLKVAKVVVNLVRKLNFQLLPA